MHLKENKHRKLTQDELDRVSSSIQRTLILKPPVKENYEDNIYYNIVVRNSAIANFNTPIPAEYITTESRDILVKSNDYQLAVIRFTLPSQLIPMFYWKEDEKNNSVYYVSLRYNMVSYDQRVEYKAIDNPAPAATALKPVFFFQQMVDAINTAYFLAFNALTAANPPLIAAGVTAPPFITFDGTYFSLFVQQAYVTNNVTVHMNAPLNDLFLFYSINQGAAAGNWQYQIVVEDLKLNSVTIGASNYYQMTQKYQTLFQWFQLRQVVFETARIPVSSEFLPPEENLKKLTRNIITDFIPTVSNTGFREDLQYNSSLNRWYDLLEDGPLSSLYIKVYWSDQTGTLYPVLIPWNKTMSIKLQFRKHGFNHE